MERDIGLFVTIGYDGVVTLMMTLETFKTY